MLALAGYGQDAPILLYSGEATAVKRDQVWWRSGDGAIHFMGYLCCFRGRFLNQNEAIADRPDASMALATRSSSVSTNASPCCELRPVLEAEEISKDTRRQKEPSGKMCD